MTTPPPFPHPIDDLSRSQRALLRILCWIAWCDSHLAEEERELLERLAARTLPPGSPPQAAAEVLASLLSQELQGTAVEELVAELEGGDDRMLAAKLAMQMAAISRRPEDQALINRAEQAAYRRLIEALQLSDDQIQEAEWAARQELEQPRNLVELLSQALRGFGAWPPLQDGDPALSRWL
ncbi:MAG: hypothetical protein VKN13_00105 [Cyanobacteriota bacterium]|nr:hypothetical protein [Cyanobacteriota bacterium]